MRRKILLFIGSPRTGSTLLGQIFNYHPNCLMSTEFRLLERVVVDGQDMGDALDELEVVARRQFETGLSGDEKYGSDLTRYQEKWVPFADLADDPDFEKGEIKVIGDKKAGGNTKVYLNNRLEVEKVIAENERVRLIQIVRHPIAAARSLMKSHKVETFEEACEQIVHLSAVAHELGKKYESRYHLLFYKDLLQKSSKTLGSALSWLKLDIGIGWLEKIITRIAAFRSQEFTAEEIEVARDLIKKHDAHALFARYQI